MILQPLVPAVFFAAVALVMVFGLIVQAVPKVASPAVQDKDLESQRITYGFWLIIAALILSLSVLIIILSSFVPAEPKTTDIVAIITALTGVFGTLVASFFGIQAAGAGRSQALTALGDQLKGQTADGKGPVSIQPTCGPHAGGTLVSITGNGFTGASAVNFGAVPATSFRLENDGLVRATSPPAPSGTNDAKVALIFPTVAPPNREVGTFYYYSIEPESRGPAKGGNTVSIRGTGLATANAVRFGGTSAAGLRYSTPDSKLYAVVPPGTAGTDVDVTVVFPVSAPTNRYTVGKYHYDPDTTSSTSGPTLSSTPTSSSSGEPSSISGTSSSSSSDLTSSSSSDLTSSSSSDLTSSSSSDLTSSSSSDLTSSSSSERTSSSSSGTPSSSSGTSSSSSD